MPNNKQNKILTMKKITIIPIFLVVVISSSFQLQRENKFKPKRIKSEININVETLGLIYYLADSSILNEGFPGSAHLIRYHLKYFLKFKDHPTVILAKRLINEGILEASTTSVFGLFFTDLPEFKQKHKIDYSLYNNSEINELKNFFKQVKKFYIDSKMDVFFNSNQYLYSKIKSEIISTLPDSNYIKTIEQYFGIQMLDYIIVPSIFIPNYFNFGPQIKTKRGIINYYVLGPAYDIKIDSIIDIKSGVGYDDKEYIERIGIHEFSHSFVRFMDEEKYVKMIESISFLNTDQLKKNIAKGYGNNWKIILEEHIVRLIEIRIAKLSGNETISNQLINSHINKNGFVYIKEMSDIITIYEKNRKTYKTFQDFFPILIKKMSEIKLDE